jgi:hypothetical protein
VGLERRGGRSRDAGIDGGVGSVGSGCDGGSLEMMGGAPPRDARCAVDIPFVTTEWR